MTLLFALAIGTIFGAGAFLLLKPDLFRAAIGIVLIANAANLAIVASGLRRGSAPIAPESTQVSDPLVQAMVITAIVIGFAVTALLLSMVYRIYVSTHTVDLDELSRAEARRERELEREEVSI